MVSCEGSFSSVSVTTGSFVLLAGRISFVISVRSVIRGPSPFSVTFLVSTEVSLMVSCEGSFSSVSVTTGSFVLLAGRISFVISVRSVIRGPSPFSVTFLVSTEVSLMVSCEGSFSSASVTTGSFVLLPGRISFVISVRSVIRGPSPFSVTFLVSTEVSLMVSCEGSFSSVSVTTTSFVSLAGRISFVISVRSVIRGSSPFSVTFLVSTEVSLMVSCEGSFSSVSVTTGSFVLLPGRISFVISVRSVIRGPSPFSVTFLVSTEVSLMVSCEGSFSSVSITTGSFVLLAGRISFVISVRSVIRGPSPFSVTFLVSTEVSLMVSCEGSFSSVSVTTGSFVLLAGRISFVISVRSVIRGPSPFSVTFLVSTEVSLMVSCEGSFSSVSVTTGSFVLLAGRISFVISVRSTFRGPSPFAVPFLPSTEISLMVSCGGSFSSFSVTTGSFVLLPGRISFVISVRSVIRGPSPFSVTFLVSTEVSLMVSCEGSFSSVTITTGSFVLLPGRISFVISVRSVIRGSSPFSVAFLPSTDVIGMLSCEGSLSSFSVTKVSFVLLPGRISFVISVRSSFRGPSLFSVAFLPSTDVIIMLSCEGSLSSFSVTKVSFVLLPGRISFVISVRSSFRGPSPFSVGFLPSTDVIGMLSCEGSLSSFSVIKVSFVLLPGRISFVTSVRSTFRDPLPFSVKFLLSTNISFMVSCEGSFSSFSVTRTSFVLLPGRISTVFPVRSTL
ncbi:uncharacterized protein LOC127007799 isoform X21 [Eriocheir sinensis]|uniref:uncharacterized protein LOC127007799 isoform X21 n=1 Tax=Eriocheir sinensis TaxID=95602 RepID=UPI0021C65CD2|nr:uncharacterized protein LOC127007799 isoform X21 [Eriocheir sinensis]